MYPGPVRNLLLHGREQLHFFSFMQRKMSGSVRLARRIARQATIPVADLPTFLCPGILRITHLQPTQNSPKHARPLPRASQRRHATSISSNSPISLSAGPGPLLETLPQQCPGCGALSQTVDQDQPGFYTRSRKAVRNYLQKKSFPKSSEEDDIVKAALENAGSLAETISLGDFSSPGKRGDFSNMNCSDSITVKSIESPVCDRCNNLKNHETGVSIYHPSVQNLQDTIFESPYKYNHIYHVLDAADFPMSLVPGLHKLLHLTPQRSLNRRSKTGRFYHGRKTEVSFIVTRSDLLAPLKTQVDSMMPYLREVLRDALGSAGENVRLGNVRCVSAKQAWWTKELKEEIWKRGGGGWMVGKVNVGKSQLLHDVFPKGRKERDKSLGKQTHSTAAGVSKTIQDIALERNTTVTSGNAALSLTNRAAIENETGVYNESANEVEAGIESLHDPALKRAFTAQEEFEESYDSTGTDSLDTSSLLPPAPLEVDYPTMPLVSALPGTTASPIRLPFGNGKGELIDLPGLSRGDLELHVQQKYRPDLVMRSRVRPLQEVIKPGQSLLLGGFIRITPTTPDLIILGYAFTPIHPHLTSTEKAIGIQMQTRDSTVVNISEPGTGEKIASAGTFHLKWDVTRQRTGPITAPEAVGIKPERLPYRVLATDILIESCGWVELIAQVRKKPGEMLQPKEQKTLGERSEKDFNFEKKLDDETIDPSWPAVEVFSPEGKFIASRRPMNAWLYVANKPTKGHLQGRPRKSMKGVKKAEKRGRVIKVPL
jgi:hypothetical protein